MLVRSDINLNYIRTFVILQKIVSVVMLKNEYITVSNYLLWYRNLITTCNHKTYMCWVLHFFFEWKEESMEDDYEAVEVLEYVHFVVIHS